MIYVIRRKSDDLYLDRNKNWKVEIDKDCWLTKEQIDDFKENNKEILHNFLIYTILNPCEETES